MATWFELTPLLRRAQQAGVVATIAGRQLWALKFDQAQLLAVVTGIGPGRSQDVAEKICKARPVDRIWNLGLCGGLVGSLKVGDLVVATEVLDWQDNLRFACELVNLGTAHRRGCIVTAASVIVEAWEKNQLAQSGAIAVDMEAAGLARIAQAREIPLVVLKVVSDEVAETLPLNFNRCIGDDGEIELKLVALELLRRGPVAAYRLARLTRRSRSALNCLADVFRYEICSGAIGLN